MQRIRILVMCLVFLVVTSLAFAGEIDILIKKLVEKGILTESEAKAVLADTKTLVKKQLEEGKLDTVPAWVQATKFSGDLRLRFENRDFVQRDDKQNRARIRFRYGFTTKVNDQITVGARLATGSSAQNNTNEQTLENAFSKRDIWLDLAYLDYKLNKNLKLLGGIFANPFYKTTDIIWGAALNPEGGALLYTNTLKGVIGGQDLDVFATLGVLPLDIGTNISPVIYGLQAGAATKVFDRKLKTAVTYYYFDGIKGSTRTALFVTTAQGVAAQEANTLIGGNYIYDYRVLDVNAEYPILQIDLFGKKMPLSVSGDFVKNVAEDVKKDEAWATGLKLGAAKDPGTWDFKYSYCRIARDATLDFLNEATLAGGGTNIKGHIFGVNYALLKNTTLTLNYFNGEKVQGLKSSGNTRDTLQLECLVKF